MSAQATFSRESFWAQNAATFAVHIGLRPGAVPVEPVGWNDLYWALDALLFLAGDPRLVDLFVSGGTEDHLIGPAMFIGDGRVDLAHVVDCSGLTRLESATSFTFRMEQADEPSQMGDESHRRRLIQDAVTVVLLDAGFLDGEDFARSLPTETRDEQRADAPAQG